MCIHARAHPLCVLFQAFRTSNALGFCLSSQSLVTLVIPHKWAFRALAPPSQALSRGYLFPQLNPVPSPSLSSTLDLCIFLTAVCWSNLLSHAKHTCSHTDTSDPSAKTNFHTNATTNIYKGQGKGIICCTNRSSIISQNFKSVWVSVKLLSRRETFECAQLSISPVHLPSRV